MAPCAADGWHPCIFHVALDCTYCSVLQCVVLSCYVLSSIVFEYGNSKHRQQLPCCLGLYVLRCIAVCCIVLLGAQLDCVTVRRQQALAAGALRCP